LAETLHVKTVVSLLDPALPKEIALVAQEKELAAQFGLDLHFLDMPYQKDIPTSSIKELLALTGQATGDKAVYVHCRIGRERTGTMVAIHRIVKDGFTAEQALKEMTGFGYDPQSENLGYLGRFILGFRPNKALQAA
jgi:protein tyrosine/serine phosphatase